MNPLELLRKIRESGRQPDEEILDMLVEENLDEAGNPITVGFRYLYDEALRLTRLKKRKKRSHKPAPNRRTELVARQKKYRPRVAHQINQQNWK